MKTWSDDNVCSRDEQCRGVSPSHETDPLVAQHLIGPARRAIAGTRQWLLARQHADGHWVGELEGDTILESEYILLLAYLGEENSERARRCAQYLIEKQLPGGGWAMYTGGKVEISGSVKAYFALKLTGHDPSAEYMQRARRAILAHGGADAVNSYTRYYLALLGQISYEHCPAVPPEVMLAPKWFPANLYAVSSWSRTIIVPLSIMSAHRPVRSLDDSRGIRELFFREPEDWPALRCPDLPGGTGLFSWDRLFRTIDRTLKWCQRHRVTPLRRRAIRKAEAWMLARFKNSDGLGAIFPPIVWSIVALRCLGYADDSPEMVECRRQLDDLIVEDEDSDSIRLQPCKSPVWDTAITLRTLSAAGVSRNDPAIERGIEWLLDKQILAPGDWSETVKAEPGGWAFEYNNDFYPDNDDTAMAVMALRSQFGDDASESAGLPPAMHVTRQEPLAESAETAVARLDRSTVAIERGLQWMLAMQNRDGGWGAFDRNNNRQFLCHVPFADHNAMIDPSTPDLTGHVLSALGELGLRVGDPAVDRAVAYLRRTQEANGSWFGRWGVSYIYGTGEALGGLAAVGVPASDPMMTRGANWLVCVQQSDGGWGESADSYEKDGTPGEGPATASQTAWAVLGLLAAGMESHEAVTRGIQFLVERQTLDGDWEEPEFTGTGFPKVFYLRYHYYRIYFPLLALSHWAVTTSAELAKTPRPTLRVFDDREDSASCNLGHGWTRREPA
ncbi:MAG TPA: squalene--hopene cyclase [Planctomycetaceae bacterium]|nr:squalene--hopene cyclase [Planctomycetaceae bacterium]